MKHETLKRITIAILFFLTLLAGLVPLKIRAEAGQTSVRQRFLSYCNCFAGGVFFATSLLDLLPMIRENYQQALKQADIHTVFPVAEFTTCMGFFLVLVVEQIVHSFHRSSFLHKSHVINNDEHPPLLVEEQRSDGLMSYILIVALSLHSVFEGLALGLITDVDRLAQIAGAITIHKSIIAFTLSVNLVQHEMQTRTVVKSAILFSIMGPIGIGIGIAVLSDSNELSSSLSSSILQGIANGTFLFVTFFEIFQQELAGQGSRLLKVLAMILGYSVVTGLLFWVA